MIRGLLSPLLLLALACACALPPDIAAQLASESDSACAEPPCVYSCDDSSVEPCALACPEGSSCELRCDVAPCTSECVSAEVCELDCLVPGACDMTCLGTDLCSTQCLSGCSMFCDDGVCDMSCPGGDCTMHCRDSTYCAIEACPSGCTLICEDVVACELGCSEADGCVKIVR